MVNIETIQQSKTALAKKILKRMYPNTVFESKTREQKAIKDIEWMLLFITEGFEAQNVKIIENLLVWFEGLFEGLNIEVQHATLLFAATKDVLHETYNDQQLDNFLQSVHVKKKPQLYNDISNPYKQEQKKYITFLLESKRNDAYNLIMDLVQNDVSVEDIYLYIFQETLREVGLLWQKGVINVGREHYCTAVTQYIMSALYPYIFTKNKATHKVLACAVGSELHEIGIRMVADFFELNGWETSYLGPNLPHEQILHFALEFQPDVIALSITMPYHISTLKETIAVLKSHSDLQDTKIIVGGIPFIDNHELYHYVGADGVALNAKEGVKVAEQLLQ